MNKTAYYLASEGIVEYNTDTKTEIATKYKFNMNQNSLTTTAFIWETI